MIKSIRNGINILGQYSTEAEFMGTIDFLYAKWCKSTALVKY